MTFLGLLVATFVSEDLACVTAGAMIARGDISATMGISACGLGIVLGDLGLWIAGRLLGRCARALTVIGRRVPAHRVEQCRVRLERHAGKAILASRFTPGARLPLYVTAGLVCMSPWRFGAWVLAASTIWTPAVVLASAQAGRSVVPATSALAWAVVTSWGVMLLGRHAARLIASHWREDARAVGFERLRRWEFWPAWLFYMPVAAWMMLLAARYRGLNVITASNPGIQDGGIVGESKFEILRSLPSEWTIPSEKIAADARDPIADALARMAARGWTWPVVLKPDVGQRGVGVRLARNAGELRQYFAASRDDIIIQPYHAGPFEAGVFYVRVPGQRRGRILSITDKQFPVIVGDGRSTVAQLIDAHPRYRLQRDLFLRRHAGCAEAVLATGERLQLAMAGNHAQGTMFCDGSRLWTPALEERIDAIARSVPGFHIGRFDIRYTDVEGFKAGRDLAIVELNGAASESTSIYDPGTSLLGAYRALFRQWALVFAIGAENRRLGAVPTPTRRLARLVLSYLTARPALTLSD